MAVANFQEVSVTELGEVEGGWLWVFAIGCALLLEHD
jgi:hypothetical protein